MARKTKLTSEQIKGICEKYLEGKTMKDLSKEYPLSPAGICLLLHKQGISGRKSSNRKYSVNETFFDIIDTEAKAYWLGFISTDGHVRYKGVEIELSIKDKDHLEKFRQDIKAEHQVAVRERESKFDTARIYISSRKLSIALNKLGLESNKTFNIRVSKKVPDNLLRHFWRGAIDGDGFLSKRKNYESRVISLCSASKGFLEDYKSFIIDHIPRFKGDITKYKGRDFYGLACCGVPGPRQLVHVLYYGATVYLDRKMELAKDIMNIKEDYIDLSSLDKETLEYLYIKNNKNWTLVAEVLEISRDSLFALRKKRNMKSKRIVSFSDSPSEGERVDSPLGHLNKEEKIEAIRKVQTESKNNSEAAKKLGLSYNSFSYLRRKLGIGIRSLPSWTSFSDEKKRVIILKAIEDYGSKKKAALELGVSIDFFLKERKKLSI